MTSTTSARAARQTDGTAFAASAAASSTRAPPKVTPVPVPKPGSQQAVSRPAAAPSESPTLPASPAKNAVRQSATPVSSAVAGRPHLDAIRPLIQDGRVRSPLPGRLKGKVDDKNGMFGVMLMGGPTTSDINKRDAEAKRASESTQLAAKQALASGQGTSRSRRFVRLAAEAPPASLVPAPHPPPPPPPPAFYGLTDAGIKQEQARLLTLLRSLNPVRVVDQICTALAFFGGIPGAPPPPDGAFPPSAMANGSGRLFVSWIAEIFPPVPSYGPPGPPLVGAPSVPQGADVNQDVTESGGKKRGRPKGSKSSRPRKDKGIKKGPVWARPDPGPKSKSGRPVGRPRKQRPQNVINPAEESWVDVDQDEEDNGGADAEAAQAVSSTVEPMTGQTEPPPTGITSPVGDPGAQGKGTPRKRGRPKGAKTRTPKATATGGNGLTSGTTEASTVAQSTPLAQPPSEAAVAQGVQNAASFTPVNSAAVATSGATAVPQSEFEHRKQGGRAKGSKNKPTAEQPAPTADTTTPALAVGTATAVETPESREGYGEQPYISYQSALSRVPPATGLTLPQSTPQTSTMDPATQPPGQKRKRKSKNGTRAVDQQASQSTGLTLPSNAEPLQRESVGSSETAPAPPPAKRQRKSNNTKSNPKSNAKASANTCSNADGQPSVGENTTPITAQESYGHTFQEATEPPAHDTLSLDVVHAISSLQSPREEGQFNVDSPTMENYQAQLHANLGQESAQEASSATQQLAAQNRVDPGKLRASQLQQQQYQQTQFEHRQQQPRQQQSQQPHQSTLQVSESATDQNRPPSLQQKATKPHQDNPRSSQATGRPVEGNIQYRPAGGQFGNQPAYSTQQAGQPQLPVQKHGIHASQGQQYPAGTQRFNTAQSQQATPQFHYPQQLAASASTTSFPASQSAQYTPSANNNNNNTAAYPSNVSFTPSYTNPVQQRSLTASTAASNGYRSGAKNRSSSTLDTRTTTPQQARQQQQHQRTSSSTSSQSQANSGLHPFTSAAAAAAAGNASAGGWEMFDATGATGQGQGQGQGGGMAGYGVGGAGAGVGGTAARGTASGNTGFAGPARGGMGGFDGAAAGYWKR